jgi:hypothetical protein
VNPSKSCLKILEKIKTKKNGKVKNEQIEASMLPKRLFFPINPILIDFY